MRRFAAAAVLLALLLAAYADAACTGIPNGPTNSNWPRTGPGACPGTAAGQNCTGSCNSGYFSLAPLTAECLGTTWATPSGSCFRGCGTLPPNDIPQGVTWPAACIGLPFLSKCAGQCPAGQYGSPTIQCLGNGYSDTTLEGRCSVTPVCSGRPTAPTATNAQPWPASCADTSIDGQCVGTCNAGFGTPSGSTPPSVQCVADPDDSTKGKWAATASGSCVRVCADTPPSGLLTSGSWPATCTNAATGSTCIANCPFGSATIKCSSAGAWDTASFTGQCYTEPVCANLPNVWPTNTKNFPKECMNAAVGSTCTAPCNQGFNSNPPPTVECKLVNATFADWDLDNMEPKLCQRVCGLLPPAATDMNATWSCSNTAIGQRCTATCPAGFIPSPSAPSISCTSQGGSPAWDVSSLTGQCIPDPGPRCTGRPTAPVPTNAQSWPASCADTPLGSSCVAPCNTNSFAPSTPPPSVQCVADANSPTGASWATTSSGTCFKACLGAPPAGLLNLGSWPASCTNLPAGQTCRADCPFGAASIRCLSSGWDTSSFMGQCFATPVCASVPSVWPTNSDNFPASCLNSPVGGNCSAPCRPGYNSNEPTVTCKLVNATFADWDIAEMVPTQCNKVCGPLPANVTTPGTANIWHCEQTPAGTRCTATCANGFVPNPTPPALTCKLTPDGPPEWDLGSFSGACIADPGPRCVGRPSASPVTNGKPFTEAACDNTPVGSACKGTCNSGFGGQPRYQVQCVADTNSPTGGSFAPVAEGVCRPVCLGSPPAELLSIGSWPTSCTSNLTPGEVCNASCPGGSNFGSASITCTQLSNGTRAFDVNTFVGRCSATPACAGLPSTAISNLQSWPSTCFSADLGSTCYGTCKNGFTADDPPRSQCVVNGSATYWSTPIPAACASGNTRAPRAFIVDSDANEVVICNDRNGQLVNCRRNTGIIDGGNAPQFNQPIGIEVKGEKVWISERNPARVRVCDWYSRRLTSCTMPSNLEDNGLTNAGQVVVSDDLSGAYVAIEGDNAVAYCRNTGSMKDCDTIEVDAVNPIGLDLAFDNIWIGSDSGLTRCPLVGGAVANETCVTTPLEPANGIWIEGNTIWLADTDGSRITVCTIQGDLSVTNCVQKTDSTLIRGPGFAGLEVFDGRLYTPLNSIGTTFVSVCNAEASSCSLVNWAVNPSRPTGGSTNIMHALPPIIPAQQAA